MKKTIALWDIVFINLVAIVGIRWLPLAAGFGASAIVLWIVAVLLFFVPLSLVAAELASAIPYEGGMYLWVRKAFGDKLGFLVSWFYWTTNFFYYPSLLTFVAVTMAFLFNPELAKDKFFVCSVSILFLWLVTFLNFISMRVVTWFAKLSSIVGTLLPCLIIIALGFGSYFVFNRPVPTDYSLSALIPNLSHGSNISLLVALMLSMAGIEITAVFAGEMENPRKNYPKAVLISGLAIIVIYVIGTMAITLMIDPAKISAAAGIMDALKIITDELNLPLLLMFMAIMPIIGSIGGMGIRMVASLKMFITSCHDGILPAGFTKLNKNDMPSRAMLWQAVIVTGIIIITAFLPSVEVFYETLLIITGSLYFIPYFLMLSAFINLRFTQPNLSRSFKVPGGKVIAVLIAGIGMLSIMLALMLPFFIPPRDVVSVQDILWYRIELIGGPVIFVFLGFLLYKRAKISKFTT